MSFDNYNHYLLLKMAIQVFCVSRMTSFYTLACGDCQLW